MESKVEELTQLWQTKQKEESEEIEIFAEEDVQRISVLEKAKGEIEQKQLNIISELNKCIQHIFNGFNYMEHYEHCYTKYVIKQEFLCTFLRIHPSHKKRFDDSLQHLSSPYTNLPIVQILFGLL